MVRFAMFPEVADLPIAAFAAQQIYQPILAWIMAFLAEFDSSDLAVALVIYLIERGLRNRRAARSYAARGRSRPRQSERITPTLSPVVRQSRPELSTTTTLVSIR
jgi:hypothetical protein